MFFMVIEKFKDVEAVRLRFEQKGRMMPADLNYVDSWIDDGFERCFQLMECDDILLFEKWTKNWDDLVDFEIIPVRQSGAAWEQRAKSVK